MLYVSPLKALAVDVERNLRAPLAGHRQRSPRGAASAFIVPAIAIRTGDTPASERARFQREPADILITTPESLFLLLTSQAREALRSVDTVIVDEIHALVPTKRGAHLALSLERLEALRGGARCSASACRPRSGRSTRSRASWAAPRRDRQPARHVDDARRATPRGAPPRTCTRAPRRVQRRDESPVTVPAGHDRRRAPAEAARSCTIEVPVEDMARGSARRSLDIPSGPTRPQGPVRTSIWTSDPSAPARADPRAPSTLLFVNSRRLAERLAGALNELAGETARALAPWLARARSSASRSRTRSRRASCAALVATSSLELGIDMGAIDLVVQIEAPPSVASGHAAHRPRRATRWARPAKASSSRSSAATCSRARR